MRRRLYVGSVVIANSETDSTIVGRPECAHAVGLFIPAPTLTNDCAVQVGVDSDAGAAEMGALHSDGSAVVVSSGQHEYFECGGFKSVRLVSGGAEGSERTIPIYALIDA